MASFSHDGRGDMDMTTPKSPSEQSEELADLIAAEHFFRTEIPGSAIPALRHDIALALDQERERSVARISKLREALYAIRNKTIVWQKDNAGYTIRYVHQYASETLAEDAKHDR